MARKITELNTLSIKSSSADYRALCLDIEDIAGRKWVRILRKRTSKTK